MMGSTVLRGVTLDEACESVAAWVRGVRRAERRQLLVDARVAMVLRARRRTLNDLHEDACAIVEEHWQLLGLDESCAPRRFGRLGFERWRLELHRVRCPHRIAEVGA